jgi:hypothetical protein
MTNADIDNLLRAAHEKGRHDMVRDDVRSFLAAKAILQDDPNNDSAKTIIANFLQWLNTGKRTISFLEFTLPIRSIFTEEELAEEKQIRDAHLKAVGRHA